MQWPEHHPRSCPPPDRRCSSALIGVLCALALAACSPFSGTGPEAAIGETAALTVEADGAPPQTGVAPVARDLAGLQESEVLGMLGEPAFAWAEGNARMWRYDGPSCGLLVFVYPDGVRHAEVIDGDEETCLCRIQGGCT